MCSSDNTHISRNHALTTNTYNGTCLDSTQQRRLQVKWHISNFIQKERAPMRLLKLTGTPLAVSPGERASFIAE